MDINSLFPAPTGQPQPMGQGLLSLFGGGQQQNPMGAMGQQLMAAGAPHYLATPQGMHPMMMGGMGGGGMRNLSAPAGPMPQSPGLAQAPGMQTNPFLQQLLQRMGGNNVQQQGTSSPFSLGGAY